MILDLLKRHGINTWASEGSMVIDLDDVETLLELAKSGRLDSEPGTPPRLSWEYYEDGKGEGSFSVFDGSKLVGTLDTIPTQEEGLVLVAINGPVGIIRIVDGVPKLELPGAGDGGGTFDLNEGDLLCIDSAGALYLAASLPDEEWTTRICPKCGGVRINGHVCMVKPKD